MPIKFEFLPVDGDAILITTEDFVMLIDGGGKSTYSRLKQHLESLQRPIDLVVLTHIDEDHIFGLLRLFEDIKEGKTTIKIKKVWFNSMVEEPLIINTHANDSESPKISRKQGNNLNALLKELSVCGIEHVNNGIHCDNSQYNKIFSLSDTIKIRLISPTEESLKKMYKAWNPRLFDKQKPKISSHNDYRKKIEELMHANFKNDASEFNASSIAFILFYGCHQFLMLGDANIKLITNQLTKVFQQESSMKKKFAFVKVSHHGSAKNTNDEFLDIIDCSNFIFCARGDHLPSKQAISRIIKNAINKKSKNNIYLNKSLTYNQKLLLDEEYSMHFNLIEKNCFEYSYEYESR